MKHFQFWNPFTARAIGMQEGELHLIHNRPFIQVASSLEGSGDWQSQLMYFTEGRRARHDIHDRISWSFFPVSLRGTWGSSRFSRQLSVAAFIYLFIKRPDVAGFQDVGGRFAIWAARLCRLLDIPYIINVAGWDLINSHRSRQYFSEASTVLVPTNRQKEHMCLSLGYRDHNLMVVPMGVDTGQFRPPVEGTYSFDPTAPRILSVGRLVPSKGILEAVQAFRYVHSEFPRATLKVIGPESDCAYVEELGRYIREHHLEDAITILGAVPYERLPAHFASADLLLFPSYSECQPYTVAESMACGTPVIALRNSGGPDEMIVHGETGLLVDVAGLAHETVNLIRQPDKLRAMRPLCERRAISEYSIERTIEGFRTALEKALSKPSRRAHRRWKSRTLTLPDAPMMQNRMEEKKRENEPCGLA